jgi:transcriptional regulator with XRE-family HTH domain
MPFDGAGLRRERAALDLTLDTLSAITHVSNCSLSKLERGLWEPSGAVARRIMGAMTALQCLQMKYGEVKLDFRQVAWLKKALSDMNAAAE